MNEILVCFDYFDLKFLVLELRVDFFYIVSGVLFIVYNGEGLEINDMVINLGYENSLFGFCELVVEFSGNRIMIFVIFVFVSSVGKFYNCIVVF